MSEDYIQPFQWSRSRLFRYRHGHGKTDGKKVWRYAASDHNFYPPECLTALVDLGVPQPGQEPLRDAS